MAWDKPILTDSGGFQVFSLPKKQITEDGVSFSHEVSGEEIFLGPKEATTIQNALGADIIMAFDECIPYPATHDYAAKSIRKPFAGPRPVKKPIPQQIRRFSPSFRGASIPDLRKECAKTTDGPRFSRLCHRRGQRRRGAGTAQAGG